MGAAETLLVQIGQIAAVILVAVGKNDGSDGLGVKVEGGVDLAGQGARALEHAAVEQECFVGDLHFVQRAGDSVAGAVECNLHADLEMVNGNW